MRCAVAVRPLLAVLALTFGMAACVKPPEEASNATPIPESDDFAFEELLRVTPSASPSPTPTLVAAGITGRSSSGTGTGSAPAAAPAPTPRGPVTCPSGTVTVEMTGFSSNDAGKDNRGNQTWLVRIRGQALNKTSRAIRDIRVETLLHVNNAEEESETATIAKWVGQGSTADWSTEFDYKSEEEPDEDNVRVYVRGWSWGDPALAQCPAHGSTG
jgi:hypothetical protein